MIERVHAGQDKNVRVSVALMIESFMLAKIITFVSLAHP